MGKDGVHIYIVEYYYSAVKKKKRERMKRHFQQHEATRDYHTKWERERQIPYDITYVWNLKYDTNEPIYETGTDSWMERTDCGCHGGGGWGTDRLGDWS